MDTKTNAKTATGATSPDTAELILSLTRIAHCTIAAYPKLGNRLEPGDLVLGAWIEISKAQAGQVIRSDHFALWKAKKVMGEMIRRTLSPVSAPAKLFRLTQEAAQRDGSEHLRLMVWESMDHSQSLDEENEDGNGNLSLALEAALSAN